MIPSNPGIGRTVALTMLVLLFAFIQPSVVKAALVLFEFNGTSFSTGATVHALMGLDSSVVVPNGPFNQTQVQMFEVQCNGSFSASTTNIPTTLAGVLNPIPVDFLSLNVNSSLTIPGHSGTNNFQFYDPHGESWVFSVTGPGPLQDLGNGTWTPAPPVPIQGPAGCFSPG